MYFLYMCKYGTLKPVKVILRKGRGTNKNGKKWKGQIKPQYIVHIYRNVTTKSPVLIHTHTHTHITHKVTNKKVGF
jgi:hypothetical protein